MAMTKSEIVLSVMSRNIATQAQIDKYVRLIKLISNEDWMESSLVEIHKIDELT